MQKASPPCRRDVEIGLLLKQLQRWCPKEMTAEDQEDCAADCVTTLLQKYYDKLEQYLLGSLPRSWLYKCMHNHQRNFLRTKHRHEARLAYLFDGPSGEGETCTHDLHDRASTPEQALLKRELHSKLNGALHHLSSRTRYLVLQHIVENATYADLAAEVGLSEDAVRMKVKRALKKVRAVLNQRHNGETELWYYLTLLAAPAEQGFTSHLLDGYAASQPKYRFS